MASYAIHQQPSPFGPQIQDQRQFDIYNSGEIWKEYSSDASPRAAKPDSQSFFPTAHLPNFSPYSMVSISSPYSSASSSSFQSESPPAEPFKTMESDYTSTDAKPNDLHYNYLEYDRNDQQTYSYEDVADMSAMTQPASMYAETYSQGSAATTLQTCANETTKFQPQQYQWQQSPPSPPPAQPTNYPSFSAQAGRMRSLSDGAPLAPTSSADGYSSLYLRQWYSGQVDHVHPQDANAQSTNTPGSYTSGSSLLPFFPRLRSFSYAQEQALHRSSLQDEYVRRQRERSMSDAALPRMRPVAYTSSSHPAVYRSFNQNLQTASTHTTPVHPTTTGIQSHASYPQQQRVPQSSVSTLKPMAIPMYGSQPIYKFDEQTADPLYTGGQGQDSRPSDELSPVLKIRQLEIQGGSGGCDLRYMNDNVKNGVDDVTNMSGSTGIGVKEEEEEEEEEEENLASREGLQASKTMASDIMNAEDGDEDAEGDCDYDDEADADYEDGDEYDPDDDDDGEYVALPNPAPENTRNLRSRSSTKTRSCRFEPYSHSSTSRSTIRPISSSRATSRPRTRMRARQTNSLPVPVPVPNLTKKSRGRRVPTVESLIPPSVSKSGKAISRKEGNGGDKNARTYTCDAVGCGKCFARGEHLKRHVRSIHTYEKPHKCPFPGCDKDFSRHDNLRQHLRVHKGYVSVKAEIHGDTEETW